jgi:hypothetical protein
VSLRAIGSAIERQPGVKRLTDGSSRFLVEIELTPVKVIVREGYSLSGFTLRFGKPVAFAVVMFCSLLYLTGSVKTAAIGTLIPLVLGALGMMLSVAYGLTALALILAVAVAIAPASVKEKVEGFISQTTSSTR